MCCWPFADVWLEDPPPPPKAQAQPQPVHMYHYPAPKPAEPAADNGVTTYTYQARTSAPAEPAQPSPQAMYYYPYYYPVAYIPAAQPAAPAPVAAPQQPVYQYYAVAAAPAPAPAPAPTANTGPIWYGATKAEIDRGNLEIAQRFGATAPQQMAPTNPDPAQQYMCYETDGTITYRRKAEIEQDLQPGYWQIAPNGGPYFVRQKPA